jgi:hypothetical protein
MMKAYRTLRTVRLAAGTVLALSDAQAAPRQHVLYPMEPFVYTAKEPLEFKAGESIGLMTPPAKGDSGLELIGDWSFDEISLGDDHAAGGDSDNTNNDDDEAAVENPQPATAMAQEPAEASKPAQSGRSRK